MSTWDDKPNDDKHAEDWRNSIIEECAREILRLFPAAHTIAAAIRALKDETSVG